LVVRGFGVTLVALATFASPALAQVTPNPELRGALRAPSFEVALMMRVQGLDVSAAANDRAVQFGFDRRFGGWSMGVKGDWSSNQSCARFDPFNPIANCAGFNWQGTAAGRVAYAWNRLTAFTQGGAVFSQWDRAALSETRAGFDTAKNVSTGWVLGGGLEYAVGTTWSLRAEYNYFDYGRPDPASALGITNLNDSYDVRTHMLMFGLKRRM
jgi:opacity protein-like surface antigen